MLTLDPFIWWIITISWSIAFLILVGIYLYAGSKTKRKESISAAGNGFRFVTNFVFIWVLIGLLVFYIVSVNIGSTAVFAAGNIVVEAILIAYLVRNRQKKSESATVQDQSRHREKLIK